MALTPLGFTRSHGQPKTLDILVKPDLENAEALLASLAEFGAPLEGLTAADFANPGPFFRMGRAPIAVDVLTEILGIEFEAAWPHRIEDVVDEKTGLKATFISAHDLIAAKLASGRLQDLADAEAVKKAQRTKQGNGRPKMARTATGRFGDDVRTH